MSAEQKLWAADPHQFGPGKVHIIDDKDDSKTLCGRYTAAIPGKPTISGQATCRICRDSVIRRPEQERRSKEWKEKRAELERQRLENNARWWDWYTQYLKTPEWSQRRSKVIERAKGICEGCLSARATQVHHVSYEHVGDELLWELRAICDACHERCHKERESK